MKKDIWQFVMMVDPFATKDDIEEVRELNEWDLLIIFRNGKKVLFDRFTGYHKNIFYNGIDELTDFQERKEFAYRLRSLMGRRWISQDQLAEMVGTTQPMISKYVRGESFPNALMLRKIAKALKCSMDDFFYKDL
jgi:DNA-binding XRE family transcriptional regulator